ncbi:MAG: metal-dependent transcriptional regulator [Chloroflexi bacterium]|nr:metal-dependent transcriptional regulator [Chloroflexota bacterium]
MSISPVMQEYLAEAYRIAAYQDTPYVSTSALATEMGVSAPAVARMASRLRDAGYIEHEPYQGMKLTASGEREALSAIRRHRLAEVFLVKVMGFGWHEVHDEADAMGTAITERIAERMEEMAEFPKRCPHGEPIPDRDGQMPRVNDNCLADVEPPIDLVVSRVHTHDPAVLMYLEELGLVPGKKVKLVSRAPFNGPLRLEIDRYEQVIGAELAGVLRVSASK